tara:strand:+ start:2837 stop:3814 length:978 start_codon:yes stop_codon:yes gene_type:complete
VLSLKNLFIDTNVFLSFYHLSNDDLEEIHKLAVLIKKKEIRLWLTEQVEDEFSRNREVKVHDAIKKLKDHKIKGAFPQFCKDYDEYGELKELQSAYGKTHSKLLKKITEDALSSKFKADEKITELFKSSKRIETSKEILKYARLRLDIGNPPGKNGSLGDAINWEALILTLPEKEELHFVADDKDYYSVLDENLPKEFLVKEWSHEKESEVIFYRRLSQFFKANYPDIKLASELEKEIEIKALSKSSNFVRTHGVIDRLSKFDEFSTTQVNQLIEACLQNDQVNWIFSDDDVYEFYTELVKNNKKIISSDLLESMEKMIAEYAEE